MKSGCWIEGTAGRSTARDDKGEGGASIWCDGSPIAGSTPVVGGLHHALVHDGLEGGMLLDVNLAEVVVLPQQDRLQTDQLKERQEHADERPLRTGVPEQAA
jgi:hypothetical protein